MPQLNIPVAALRKLVGYRSAMMLTLTGVQAASLKVEEMES